jgi:hypothetical protein
VHEDERGLNVARAERLVGPAQALRGDLLNLRRILIASHALTALPLSNEPEKKECHEENGVDNGADAADLG